MKTQIQYTLSNLLKLLETLILNIGLARVLTDVSEFGRIQQFFVIVTFFVTISSAFPMTLNYFAGKCNGNAQLKQLFNRVFFTLVMFALFSVGFLLIFKSLLVQLFNNNYFLYYNAYFVLILFFKIVNNYFSNYFLFSANLKFLNITGFVLLVVYSSVFIYFFGNARVELLLLIFVVYDILKFILYFIPFTNNLKHCRRSSFVLKPIEVRFLMPSIFLVLSGIINMQIDKYMISIMESPEVFAVYQVGAFNIPFIAVITTSLFTIITPEIVKYLDQDKIDSVVLVTKITVMRVINFLLPVVVYCCLFADEIILFLFGMNYEQSGEIFALYSLRFLLSVFPFSIYMGIIGLKNMASVHVIASAFLNIILNLIFIPIFGVFGAVIATLVSSYSTVFIPIHLINKRLSTRLKNYFPVNHFFKLIILSLLIAMPFYLLREFLFYKQSYMVLPVALVFYIIVLVIVEGKSLTRLSLIKR